MLLLQFGSMGKELAKYNTKLFAEQVLPKLRPLFSEWEDKWWPEPMRRRPNAPPRHRSRPARWRRSRTLPWERPVRTPARPRP